VLDEVVADRLARNRFRTASGGLAPGRAAPHAGAAIGFGFRVTVGALLLVDQRLPVGDGNLVVIRVDFAERQKAMAVAAIVYERRLERRLDPRHFGKVDVASQLAAACRFEIEFLNAVAAQYDHPGLFRVGRIDKHLVGHWCVSWQRAASCAPGVHELRSMKRPGAPQCGRAS